MMVRPGERRGRAVVAAANVLRTCQVSPAGLCGVGTRCIFPSQMRKPRSRGRGVLQLFEELFKLHASSSHGLCVFITVFPFCLSVAIPSCV